MAASLSSAEPGGKTPKRPGLRQIERRRGVIQQNRALQGSDFGHRCETVLRSAQHDPVQAEPQGLKRAAGGVTAVKKTIF